VSENFSEPQTPSLHLADQDDEELFSYEFGTMGIKLPKHNFEIGSQGMRNIQTGEMIVGTLVKTDLVLGEILGNGASGYVYAALHKPTGK
jgi:hypothetical protein